MNDVIPGDPLRTLRNTLHEVGESIRDAFTTDDETPLLPTVTEVDLKRYAGLWYELARLPLLFQDDATVSTAEYTLRDDGSVGVLNRSYHGDEQGADISGVATPAKGAEESCARLKVQFGGIVKLVPVPDEGNYWICQLTPDYSMALVGTPDRKSLWLLARDPKTAPAETVTAYLTWAHENHFDLTKLLLANWDTRETHPFHTAQGKETPSD